MIIATPGVVNQLEKRIASGMLREKTIVTIDILLISRLNQIHAAYFSTSAA
jgi:hypothetical protein